MAEKQEGTSPTTPSEEEPIQANPEVKKVEISIEPEKKATAPKVGGQTSEDLSQLTPDILEALTFNSSGASEGQLRSHNIHLQSLLGKVIELLKEKSSLCSNLEKQNTALMLQSNSLKDVVAITKDLLSIRNMEVEHLHVDIKSMEEKINHERERHNNMLNRMSEAVKLNENLKTEYQSQLSLFTELRARYEEKVAVLEKENKRLSGLATATTTTGGDIAPPATEQTVEGKGDV